MVSFQKKIEDNGLTFYFDLDNSICIAVKNKNVKFFERNFTTSNFDYFLDGINYELEDMDDFDELEYLQRFGVYNWYIIDEAYNYSYDNTTEDQTVALMLQLLYDQLYN